MNSELSKEMLNALKEVNDMIKDPDKYPAYTNSEKLEKALLSDN